jgi:hypothetical protein
VAVATSGNPIVLNPAVQGAPVRAMACVALILVLA